MDGNRSSSQNISLLTENYFGRVQKTNILRVENYHELPLNGTCGEHDSIFIVHYAKIEPERHERNKLECFLKY